MGGLIKVNGVPIELVQPESLRFKVWEPVLLLGANRYREVDIRIRVKGGGNTSQIYAIRQAIAKSLVAWARSTSMRPPSATSRRSSCRTTEPSSWRTPVARSPRSSVVAAPAPASRSRTVDLLAVYIYSICRARLQ